MSIEHERHALSPALPDYPPRIGLTFPPALVIVAVLLSIPAACALVAWVMT